MVEDCLSGGMETDDGLIAGTIPCTAMSQGWPRRSKRERTLLRASKPLFIRCVHFFFSVFVQINVSEAVWDGEFRRVNGDRGQLANNREVPVLWDEA